MHAQISCLPFQDTLTPERILLFASCFAFRAFRFVLFVSEAPRNIK
jgi:hypothetical protein